MNLNYSQELAELLKTSTMVLSNLELEVVLRIVAAQIVRLVGGERGTFYRWNEIAQRLQVWATYGADSSRGKHGESPGNSYPLEERPLAARVLRQRRPVTLQLEDTPPGRTERAHMEQRQIQSLLLLPLIAHNQVVGLFELAEGRQSQAFNTEEITLAQILANQAAIAITNAHLAQEHKRRITELSILTEISLALSSALEGEKLMENLHQQVGRLFDASNFYVALYEEDSDSWDMAFYVQKGKRQSPNRYRIDQGLTGYIIRERRPLMLRSRQESIAFHQRYEIEFAGERAQSWMGAPLIASDNVVGVMAIQSYEQENCYREQDLTLFSSIAAQAAIAIENARLYSRGQQRLNDLRQAYEDVRRTEERLIEAQKMETMGLLSAGVAHDFNNLLTIVSLYTDQALYHLLPSSPLYPDLEEVRQATLRATALIRQLLTFSRRQPIKRQPLNLGTRVAVLLKLLRRLTREDVSIKLDLPGELWPAYADPGGIEQILINLTMNARDAMPYGGRIRLALANVEIDEQTLGNHPGANPGPYVCLSVEDDGEGMAPETLERIFEPFFTTKSPGRGTGLGLSVVKNIVERHNGWIEVESAPDKGTCFDVYLPAVLEVEQTEEQLGAVSPPPGHGQKILLVEDNAPLRRALAQALRDAGYSVLTAVSSEEAQAFFVQEQGKVDLLLSDVILPGERGYLLADTLTKGRPQLRVLLISGYMEDREEWAKIEERDYPLLEKPFSLDQLLREVYGILETRG